MDLNPPTALQNPNITVESIMTMKSSNSAVESVMAVKSIMIYTTFGEQFQFYSHFLYSLISMFAEIFI